MELITKPNKRFRFLLCVTDICSKYVWVVFLKYEKGITITSNFQNILDESKCNPNKRWIDKSSEFYNRSITTWLGKKRHRNVFTTSWRKICYCWRFIRTLRNKIYKYMTSISKNVYIDKLDDIVYKCNSTVAIIKMKPVDVKLNTSINSAKKLIIMILNLKLVIFREYQNTKIFLQKVTLQIPLKKFLWLKKLKTLFTKNNCKKNKSKRV